MQTSEPVNHFKIWIDQLGIGNTKTNTYKQNSADLRRKKKDKQANKTKAKKKKTKRDIQYKCR